MNTIPGDYTEVKGNEEIEPFARIFYIFSFGETRLVIDLPYFVPSLRQFIDDKITPKDSKTFAIVYDALTHIEFPIYLIDLGQGPQKRLRLLDYLEKHPEIDPANTFTTLNYDIDDDYPKTGNPFEYKKSK